MKSILDKIGPLAVFFVTATTPMAQAQLGSRVPNWNAPENRGAIRALADVTSPLPFIGVTPCRIVDTRGPAGPFGAPALAAGIPRDLPLPTGPCSGLPTSPRAYSLNITVTNTLGPGFISIYPQGGPAPIVSTLNYNAGQTLANAAIVAAGTSGGVTVVAGVSGTDLIIDINGYYAETPGTATNAFRLLNNSSNYLMFVSNASTSCSGACGLLASVASTSNGASAISGQALGTSGAIYGVSGTEASVALDSAGVRGIDASGPPAEIMGFPPAGVRGETRNFFGVLGISQAYGVVGSILDPSGTLLAEGHLGDTAHAGGPWAVYAFGNLGGSGAKSFVEVHPTDAGKSICYVALEGPEAGTYFRGTEQTSHGMAVMTVPESFRLVTDSEGLTVQLTPVGAPAMMYVVSQDLHKIVVRSSRDVKFHYLVNGVRQTFKDWQPVVDGGFMPESPRQNLPVYFSEEQKQRLIDNGTYNADGTVNLATAEREGWTKIWAGREAKAEALRRIATERSISGPLKE